MNFTHHNHLKYYIGPKLFGFRSNPVEKFTVQVGQVDPDIYKKSNFQNELTRTAHLVSQDFGNDFVLLLSGGTDSEIVAHNFCQIGRRPRCVTIKFRNDYNITDVSEAQRICRHLDLKHEIIEFDIQDFFYSGEAEEFGLGIQCTQITYIMCYKLIHRLQTAAVMGGEALLNRNISPDGCQWYWTFRENEDASAMRFSLKYDIPLVNEWFSYTPELLLYYLEDPDIQQLVSDRYNYKLSSVSSKNKILKKLCPYVSEKKKTHGFEKLLAFNQVAYKQLGRDQIPRLEFSLNGIFYKDIIFQLRGNLCNGN